MASVGLLLALVCIIVSIVFAIIPNNQLVNPVWWALLAIFVVLFFGVKSPWP